MAPSPRGLPWLSLSLASLAMIIFIVQSASVDDVIIRRGTTGVAVPEKTSIAPEYFPQPRPDTPISDSREFLKRSYNAAVRTRNVDELGNRIQTIVRGYSGRIDGYSSSPKNGYVSFAVPADKLEVFRAELKNTVRAKFYTESVSSQNLLPQKQSIEEQQKQSESELSRLRSSRNALADSHNTIVASIQARLKTISTELAQLRSANPADPKITQLTAEETKLRVDLAAENREYLSKLASLDSQIRSAEDTLASIKKQDQDLLDNVATVQGYITLNWISVWEIVDLYLPGPLLAWAFLAAAAAAYFWHRSRMRLIIP